MNKDFVSVLKGIENFLNPKAFHTLKFWPSPCRQPKCNFLVPLRPILAMETPVSNIVCNESKND